MKDISYSDFAQKKPIDTPENGAAICLLVFIPIVLVLLGSVAGILYFFHILN